MNNELPKIGSLWKVIDPNSLPVAVPQAFLVSRVGQQVCFEGPVISEDGTAYRVKKYIPVVVCRIGRFELSFTPDEMKLYEEIDPASEEGGLLLLKLA